LLRNQGGVLDERTEVITEELVPDGESSAARVKPVELLKEIVSK
jgi:hypothetical protein